MAARKITVREFLARFMEHPRQPFCFLLGAGASRPSGIPTGGELVARWLGELHARECVDHTPLARWATAGNLGIDGFEFGRAARFYPQVFKRRFAGRPEEGYACLEELLREGGEPSLGYLVLAQILTDERLAHRVVLTPNFDHLAADALAIATRATPLACDHEALTGFLGPQPRGPLIARTYRDFLREPLNAPPAVSRLGPGWDVALRALFNRAVPLVIGYAGNDGSLLELLRGLPAATPDGCFWCYLDAEGPPEDPEIDAFVEAHHGAFVPIAGFDEFMLQLSQALGLPPLAGVLEARAREREAILGERLESLRARRDATLTPSAAADLSPWQVWDQWAKDEPDPGRREAIYRRGLATLPRSADLAESFAEFLFRERKDPGAAETFFRQALELDPGHTGALSRLGAFLSEARGDHAGAESLLRRSLEIDPDHSRHTGMLATFLYRTRQKLDEAERLYRRALELDPFNAITTGNFASFLCVVHQAHDEAERLYRRAMFMPPNYALHISSYAVFMYMVRGDDAEAERLFARALELDPENPSTRRKHQMFLQRRKGRGNRPEAVAAVGVNLLEREGPPMPPAAP